MRFDSRNDRPHRVMFEAVHGPIPGELHIDHLCRVRDCSNPAHLEAVTPSENVYRRSRWSSNGLSRTTHCRRGHRWSADNIYLRPDGLGRQCRACIKIRSARAELGSCESCEQVAATEVVVAINEPFAVCSGCSAVA